MDPTPTPSRVCAYFYCGFSLTQCPPASCVTASGDRGLFSFVPCSLNCAHRAQKCL